MRAHLDIAHTGTLTDARRSIKFAEDATDVLEGILIELYEDPELACVREMFTNARDSHVAAGQVLPVEVELPSPLRMTFVMRDRGVGLDPDDIDRIFQYGASTKRDTDEAVGMLGLGLKAPLAYTSQFTLVAVKHGMKSTVLVTRSERGGGAFQVVDTCATDEPNGVEVTIPTTGYSLFNEKAKRFFLFTEPGVVLVNGEPPESIPGPRDLTLDPDVIVTTRNDIDVDYIVMGNVPYPVPYSEDDLVDGQARAHAIVRVPIGSVDFTPSREALKLTKRTMEVLHEARTFISMGVERKVQAEVAAAPTHLEALRIAVEWRASFMRFPNLRYRDDDVPTGFNSYEKQTYRWEPGSEWNQAKQMSWIDAGYLVKDTVLHVVGSKVYGVRKELKKRVDKYLDEQDLTDRIERVVFYPEPLTKLPWLDGVTTVDYEVIKAIKLPSDNKPPKPERPKGSYRVFTFKDGYGIEEWTEADKIKLPAVYVMANERTTDRALVRRLVKGFQLVIVEKPRLATFRKDVPSAVHVSDLAKANLNRFASLPPAELFVLDGGGGKWTHRMLSRLPPRKVLDPELSKMIRTLAKGSAAREDYDNARRLGRLFDVDRDEAIVRAIGVVIEQVNTINRRYALVSDTSYGISVADALEYVNAIYLTRQRTTLVESMFTAQKIQPDTQEKKS